MVATLNIAILFNLLKQKTKKLACSKFKTKHMVKNRDDMKGKKKSKWCKNKKHGQVTFVKRIPTPASDETWNMTGMIVSRDFSTSTQILYIQFHCN